MQASRAFLFAGVANAFALPASAADQLKFGAPPSWAQVHAAPDSPARQSEAPFALLLRDEQSRLDPGRITTYTHTAIKVQRPDGLSAGNVVISWDPALETVTVHKVQLRRGKEVIDVLAAGQKFTTIRRESRLEYAVLDGRLTATLQPEGLREGDIIELATTIEHADPVLKDHVEAPFAAWNGIPVALAYARVDWPASMNLKLQQSGDLQRVQPVTRDGRKSIELMIRSVEPQISPKGAPPRFGILRLGEASDFRSWADAADLMAPLYKKAEAIPASGPLRDEVNKIGTASTDPKVRAEMALQLVQDRVRYVGLFMGQAGYLPATAEETWARRFGDCKAKTALLLGILHAFNIEAESVAVASRGGDAIADRLPRIGVFDHVLVRARIGGKTYWLDGTRTGDQSLDTIDVPYFGWGLPLVSNSKLVSIVPPPLANPSEDTKVVIDASKGVYAPVAFSVDQTLRGDEAVSLNRVISAVTEAQRTEFFRSFWKEHYDFVTPGPTSTQFDPKTKLFRLSMRGQGKLDWRSRYFHVPDTTVGFNPDFERAAGPSRDAPIAVRYPSYARTQTVLRFPAGFFADRQAGKTPTTSETLAGIELRMTKTQQSDALSDTIVIEASERSIVPEVSYKEAVAAAPRLRELADQDVAVPLPAHYRPTKADLAGLTAEQPTTGRALFERGLVYLNANQLDEAIADFTAALAKDPKDPWSLANRGLAYAWKNDAKRAEADLAAAAALDPDNLVAERGRGLLAEIKRDYAAAVAAYTSHLAREPQNSFVLLRRAMVYRRLGELDKALGDARQLADISGKPEYRSMLADLLLEKDKLKEATAEADKIVNGKPTSSGPWVAAAKVYARAGKRDKAAATLAQATMPDENGFIAYERAKVLAELGRPDEAIAVTTQALKMGEKSPDLRLMRVNILMGVRRDLVAGEVQDMLKENPQSDYALVAAGKIYAALGQRDKAMQAFDRALAIKPAAYIYVNRAQSRPRSDVAGRKADLDAALKLEPADPSALAEKADFLSKTGDYEGAISLLDRVKVDESDTYAQTQRAVVLYKAKRIEEAKAAFGAVRTKSTTAQSLNNLCWGKATAGVLLESALEDCRAALKLSPGTGAYEDSLGMVLLKLGRLDDALHAYNAAVESRTGSASLMGRALVYARKGDRKRANEDAAAARKLDSTIDDRFEEYGLSLQRQ